MSALRTLAVATGIALCSSTPSPAEDDVLRMLASCTGRLSAQLEYQWLLQDPEADRTEHARATMADLLEAVTEPETARQALHLRIIAKEAQSRLLMRAMFNGDRDDAAWARRRATDQVTACAGLLLS